MRRCGPGLRRGPDVLVGAAYPGGAGTAGITSGTSGSTASYASDGTIRGVTTGDGVGWSVASPGDVDGDGQDDVLVGAPGVDTAGADAGGAYVFFGPFSSSSQYITAADAIVLGDDMGDRIGREVPGAGDTDGDGLPDLAFGIPEDNTVATDAGGVWLFHTLTGTMYGADADAIVLGELAGDFGGSSVSSAGDLDADGYDDLLVGLPGSSGTGWAAILYGPLADGNLADATTTFLGEQAGDEAGFAVAGLGDRDGDGVLDVGIGASGSDLAGTDAGAVYVIFGPATGAVDLGEQLVFTGDTSDRAGTCVANAGDVDADGNDDLLAVGFQSAGPATGWVMLAP